MAFYTDVDLGANRPLTLSDMEPSIWQGVKASFALSLDANPLASIRRIERYYGTNLVDTDNAEEIIELASAFTGSDFGLPAHESEPSRDTYAPDQSSGYDVSHGTISAPPGSVQGDAQGDDQVIDQTAGQIPRKNPDQSFSQTPTQSRALPQPRWRMKRDAQQKEIDANDLTGIISPDPHYDSELLADVILAKKTERARQLILQNQKGLLPMLANFGAGFAGGMLDPINIVSGLVPVVPAARVSQALAQASGTIGRAMVRAGAGAVSGAAGAAMVEPLVYAGQQAWQADYTAVNSLQNIAFGAIMGAGMHTASGAIRAGLNKRRGIANEWEYARDDKTSLALLDAQRQKIEAALSASDTMTGAEISLSARKAAQDFHNSARRLAYLEHTSIAEQYRRYDIDWRNGELVARGADDVIGRMADTVSWQAETLPDAQGFGMTNPRARLSLYSSPENTRVIVDFFSASDVATAPTAMIGIIRRQLHDAAASPNASRETRLAYQGACDFVGAEYGKAWTPAQEKMFGDSYMKYLAEGSAPNSAAVQSMNLVRRNMLELYNEAHMAGMEISPAMRKVFNRLNSIPIDEGYRKLRQALVSLDDWRRFAPDPESVGQGGAPRETASGAADIAANVPHETGAGNPAFVPRETSSPIHENVPRETQGGQIDNYSPRDPTPDPAGNVPHETRPQHSPPSDSVPHETASDSIPDAMPDPAHDPASTLANVPHETDLTPRDLATAESLELQDYNRRLQTIAEKNPELADAISQDAREMLATAEEGLKRVETEQSLIDRFIACELA